MFRFLGNLDVTRVVIVVIAYGVNLSFIWLAIAVLLGCSLLRVHWVVTFLAVMTLALTGCLVYFGLNMMRFDLTGARDRLARSSSYASANQSSRSISRFITDALEQDVVAGAGDMETELQEEETEFEPEGQAGSNIYSQFAVRVPRDVDV